MYQQKKTRKRYRTWNENPKEPCPKDEQGNNRNITCFVPSCCNGMWKNGKKNKRLLFFKVPDGIEGLLWTKAIKKIGVEKYKRLLDAILNPDTESINPYNSQYCSEAHFDIRHDIERVHYNNGYVEFNVKNGVLPSVQRRQNERLVDIIKRLRDNLEDYEMKNEVDIHEESMADENSKDPLDSTESTNDVSTNDFPSIVDVFTLKKESTIDAPRANDVSTNHFPTIVDAFT